MGTVRNEVRMSQIQRGEVHDVMPDPSVGKEIQKKRPCVVVSVDVLNANSGLCIVCPMTEGINLPVGRIHIAISKGDGGTTKDSIVLCDQIKAVDQARLVEKRGNLKAEDMRRIDAGIRLVLGF